MERDWAFAAMWFLAAAGQWLPLGWRGWPGVLRGLLVASLLVLAGLSFRQVFA